MAPRLLLVAIATAIGLFCAVATSQDDNILKPSPFSTCSATDNYTDGSQYKKNLDRLLAMLPKAAGDNGWFHEGSAGTGADEVFGLIMCYADYNAEMCLDCLSRASTGITTVCPGSRNVCAMYDPCTLQYSATPFPATADINYLYTSYPYTPGVTVTLKDMKAARALLMNKLAAGVTGSPLRFANDTAPYTSSLEMYGLAQCTRDLNASECSKCINKYVSQLPALFPNSSGGVIKGCSCYLRYQVGYDIGITLPPSPPPARGNKHALPPLPTPARGHSSSSETGFFIIVSVGSIVFLTFLAFSMWLLRRRRRNGELLKESMEMDEEFKEGTGPKQFRYGDLSMATDNFSDNHKLGEGGFGSVYRGFLKDMDLHVAIKRVSKDSKQGRKEYASEVRIISRLRHRNLVQLIGWCHGGGELLLVYELMPNGSLDKHLYSATNHALPWTRRYEILLGLGSALLYLHEECEQCVVHRDIKPSNVMLDTSFNAKLGDFGLARLVDHARGSLTTLHAGTLGYMDPECLIRGRASASTQSDVYSFGVVLLEIACGQSPAIVVDEAVIHLAWHVSELHSKGRVLDAADPKLNREFNAREMESVLITGLWCTQDDRSLRPSIRQVLGVLRLELPLPTIPERPPVAIYKPPVGLQYSDPSSQGTNSSIREMSTSFRPLGANDTMI